MQQIPSEKSCLTFIVIDDHESVLNGTVEILRKNYPSAEFNTATNASYAFEQVINYQPDLLVMDLSIPEKPEMTAKVDIGIQLLKVLMENYSHLNLVVQSAHVKTLIRIRPYIDNHKGGFTVADKSLPTQEMLTRVDWALQGLTHTKDIKGIHSGLEVKPEWLKVLELAFEEGLQDKVIAKNMCISERMVRHYWSKLQDALNIYPEEGKNIRIQTEMRARAEGLID
ncbi:response regulator transcription factor [Aphanizomenon flos-aquae NRERC-008]|uniref:Response regulator transcription factor n=1 Tax=Aphanizomenon flos-aquae FACHB-1249 TaxID=2692889 RepID=A0ABR8ISS1_APHFL|nr:MULTISPECIES: response regulator transcription factor [Aphanizomenon]MBD2390436.1 response regulator transcription factor [Aphanizomenon flos-aquae FACHB-1171]MBD2557117.1 response regulator transcription factor [Aphanizomenon flos-aquae FACHB-1290]MBD2632530.1 response regulator transcription factor [Aphanizomenon sp. FACHB-1399]MBD2643458.1 response regulator transcription factor [Aphanizomenon sp. FACHB-1401]MBD2657305.1 response regulator transcription factor [Aphanizomenon flos-aquae F